MDINFLKHVYLFQGLSEEQLSGLLDIAEEVTFDAGDVLFVEGTAADFLWVFLTGRMELVRRSGHEERVVRVIETPGLWAGGFAAWNSEVGYLGSARAASSGSCLKIAAADLREWAMECFPFGVHMLDGLSQTAHSLEILSRERENQAKLASIAARLAHEINNPAAASVRTVDAVQGTADTLLASLVELAEHSVQAEQFVALDALRRELHARDVVRDPVALADGEDALSAWLEKHDVSGAWRLAPQLAAFAVDVAWCERVAGVLPPAALEAGLTWVANTMETTSLIAQAKDSTARVSDLVSTMKSYTQMDRASLQVVDITEGIESSLTMMGHKLPKGVAVVRDYAADVPRVEVSPGQLNQVWTNLIDNALDAMGESGTLTVRTRAEDGVVVVEIADTGPGMTPDVRAKAFTPLFTTKEIGKGTGLGLDISRRIVVDIHDGEISIDSQPGNNVLRVSLPVRQ